jgi:hypothetical protein
MELRGGVQDMDVNGVIRGCGLGECGDIKVGDRS